MDTGLTTLSVAEKGFDLLTPEVDFMCETKRKPLCVPQIYKLHESLPSAFVDDAVRLVARLSLVVAQKVTFRWIFPNGQYVTTMPDSNSTVVSNLVWSAHLFLLHTLIYLSINNC